MPRRTQTIIEWLEVTGDIIALDIHSFDVAIETLLLRIMTISISA